MDRPKETHRDFDIFIYPGWFVPGYFGAGRFVAGLFGAGRFVGGPIRGLEKQKEKG